MAPRYNSFQNLPPEVADRLRKRIIVGRDKYSKNIPKGTSIEERRDPEYTEEELTDIIRAFTIFNDAVRRGLPNQLYQMLAKTLDSCIGERAYAAHLIWYAHEDEGQMAKEAAQGFADTVKKEIDKRSKWHQGQFDREYFLGKE